MKKKLRIDAYFLGERSPFSKRREPNWKRMKLLGGVVVVVLILALLIAVPSQEKGSAVIAEAAKPPVTSSVPDGEAKYLSAQILSTKTSGGPSRNPRQFAASQLVRRDGVGNGDKIPMGFSIPAKLVNAILSSDSNSPVIAEILEDVIWKNSVMVPAGSRAIGQASLNDDTQRVQARFQTLVFPEGDQHSVSALALMGDGSSGVAGNYNSRMWEKQGGRFLGNFVGGLADGMKDRNSTGGQFGIVMEPGSIKNGILNGLAASSFDQAKVYADSTQNLKAYLGVPAGTTFLLYLEREFGP